MDEMIRRLTDAGGRRWQKGAMDRVYFNADAIMELIEFCVSYYKTGNVCSASIAGDRISNSSARQYLGDLENSKFWVDLADGSIHVKRAYRASDHIIDLATDAIEKVAEA